MICVLSAGLSVVFGQRHWTVADGLPTGEVRQIVELPGGQMLVNCEGVFCISNGHSFDVVPCDQNRAYQLSRYANRYGQLTLSPAGFTALMPAVVCLLPTGRTD